MVFVLILLMSPLQGGPAPHALLGQQKLHDLLLVWAMDGSGAQEMEKDANFFLGSSYALEIDGQKMPGGLSQFPPGRGNGKTVGARIIIWAGLGGVRAVKLSFAP